MERGEKIERFSSCRGVAFEIKANDNLFSIPPPTEASMRSWFARNSSRIAPSGSFIQRTLSRPSSHFCDIDIEDESDNDSVLSDIEEASRETKAANEEWSQSPEPLIPLPSRREQPPKQSAKPKHNRIAIMLLDQGLFTVYKRLFAFCLSLNITALVLAATGHFPYARNHPAVFGLGNVLALTLARSELFLRFVFWLVVKVLGHSWVPIWLKNITSSFLQSVGGIHSSCGVSSILWLGYGFILTLKDRDNTSDEIVAVASSVLSLLFISALLAFPLVRHLHHNVFERTHRFGGWLALALLWVFIVLTTAYNPKTRSYSNNVGSGLIKQQEFWFTVVITALTIIPWMTVRRVEVDITSPSGHASLIKFKGGVQPGILGRISPSPLSEWHAFGIISDGKDQHMMLAGAVGDFTKSLVANPPSHLWIRQVHFAGLSYCVNLYEKVLVVATGSGICVFLSYLLNPGRADVRFLWITKGVEQNFGKEITQMMSGHPEDRVIIHDTALHGRPNVKKMCVETAKKWGVQVVHVTSNPEGTRDVVSACKAAGITAFGPVWDS